jgi:hypothetical protein
MYAFPYIMFLFLVIGIIGLLISILAIGGWIAGLLSILLGIAAFFVGGLVALFLHG